MQAYAFPGRCHAIRAEHPNPKDSADAPRASMSEGETTSDAMRKWDSDVEIYF